MFAFTNLKTGAENGKTGMSVELKLCWKKCFQRPVFGKTDNNTKQHFLFIELLIRIKKSKLIQVWSISNSFFFFV